MFIRILVTGVLSFSACLAESEVSDFPAIAKSLRLSEAEAENHVSLKGNGLISFLKDYVEVEIQEISKGHSISLHVPNADASDRQFYSIQLFLIKHVESKESEIDVFEVTSSPSHNGGDINFLMNISHEKERASYVVFREERRDNPRKESHWIETTIRIADLLQAKLPKGDSAPPE